MFTKGFDKYACVDDSITCEFEGFTVTATIRNDDTPDKPDERQDGFWPSLDPSDAGYIGDGKSRLDLSDETEKMRRIYDAWKNDEWYYVGIIVKVEKLDVELAQESLWGIECNYPGADNSYLMEVANELLPEAIAQAKAKIAKFCERAG